MSWLEGTILGLIQGLSEFLPISSSGHLTIFQTLFGIGGEGNLTFDVAVHLATVFSIIVVFWNPIIELVSGLFKKGANKEKDYFFKLLISMIPILLVGLLLKPFVEKIFATDAIRRSTGNGLLVVGICLVVTAILLLTSEILSAVMDLRHGADADEKEKRIVNKIQIEEGMSGKQKRKIFAQHQL